MKSISARASPIISMSTPRKTKSGTASRMSEDMPSSTRLTTMLSGIDVVKLR